MNHRAWLSAAFGLAAFVLPHLITPAAAADQPNLLIMGEDADEDTVPRHNRAFNRVNDALRTRMMEVGFKVYNETAVTMEMTNPGRVRRTDAELITVAQSVTSVPIDVVVAFQIYAQSRKAAYGDINQLQIRVRGHMLQMQTGRDLGVFEASVGPRGLKPLPVNCNRDCVLEHVGNEARIIANDVGTVLARQLDALSPTAPKAPTMAAVAAPPPVSAPAPAPVTAPAPMAAAQGCTGLSSAYMLVFTGYEPSEMHSVETMITSFQGYERHRPVRTQNRYAEIWYESCSDRARLERNVRVLTEQFSGQSRVAYSGSRFEIEKIAAPAHR